MPRSSAGSCAGVGSRMNKGWLGGIDCGSDGCGGRRVEDS
jgi:hypothetical protein